MNDYNEQLAKQMDLLSTQIEQLYTFNQRQDERLKKIEHDVTLLLKLMMASEERHGLITGN